MKNAPYRTFIGCEAAEDIEDRYHSGNGNDRSRYSKDLEAYVKAFVAGIARTEKNISPLNENLKRKPKSIVIEGCHGDDVTKRYWPAIEGYVKSGDVHLWLADLIVNEPNYLTRLKKAGGDFKVRYYGKDNPADMADYEMLNNIDEVIIATWDRTHSDLASGWLPRAKRIFIEKPLDASIDAAKALRTRAAGYEDTEVLCFDHYRVKAIYLKQGMPEVLEALDFGIREVTFYLLEPQTIESEGREKALQEGLLLDLGPHFLALMTYIGPLGSIENLKAKGASYIFKDKNGILVPAGIPNETFAHMSFDMESYGGDSIRVNGCVGKGVVKSENDSLYLDKEAKSIKFLEIAGMNGKRIRLDLASSDPKATILDSGKRKPYHWFGLTANPHKFFLDTMISDTYDANPTGFSINLGIKQLELFEEGMKQVRDAEKKTYTVGDSLETILEGL